MEYNLCIFHFADNKQHLRLYYKPIHKNDTISQQIAEKRDFVKNFNKENNVTPDKDWSNYVSKNRTINNIYHYSRNYDWDYFITLTFNKSRVNRYNYDDCLLSAKNYFQYIRNKFCPDLTYLLVPETHEDGAFHFHGAIGNTKGLPIVDSGKRDCKDRIIYNLPTYIYGFSTATKCDNNFAVSSYMTKYITKELVLDSRNRKRYLISNNLKKPETTVYMLSEKDKIRFIESIGKDILFTKKLEYENQSIQYIELENFNPIETMDKLGIYPQ